MITIQDYQTRFPNNNSEYFNKLGDKAKEGYVALYQKYHGLVLKYLLAKTSLLSFDKSLKNNEDKFVPVDKANMDLYQFLCSDSLNYFYLRNNLYIEHLTSEELEYLKSVDVNGDTTEFIEKTLQRAITELPDKNEKVNLCFGGDALKFFKPNGSLVIGVRYDEFSDKIPDDDKWMDTYMDIKGELEMFMDTFTFTYPNINNIPIEVIQYNEYSVVGLNSVDISHAPNSNEITSNNEPKIEEIENKNKDKDKDKDSDVSFY